MPDLETLRKRRVELRREAEANAKSRRELDERDRSRQAELQKVEQALTAVEQTSAAAARSVATTANAKSRAAAEVGRAKGLLDRLRQERKAHSAEYDESEKRLAVAQSKVKAQRAKVEAAEEAVQKKREALETAQRDVSGTEREVHDAERELNEVPQRILTLRQRLEQDGTELERALNGHRHDVALFLEPRIDTTIDEMEKATAAAPSSAESLQKLRLKLHARQREVIAARASLEQAQKALGEARVVLRAAEAEQDPRSRRR